METPHRPTTTKTVKSSEHALSYSVLPFQKRFILNNAFSFSQPHKLWNFCWDRAGKTLMDQIKVMLNKLISCINFQPYRYSDVNTLFIKDQILQIDDVFVLELGKFMYKFNTNQLPPV